MGISAQTLHLQQAATFSGPCNSWRQGGRIAPASSVWEGMIGWIKVHRDEQMKKWFWPLVTWTAAITALALWFGAGLVSADIASRTELALKPYPWASFDVDGRDVVIKGVAPDPESQAEARLAVEQVAGVREVTDSTAVLPLASPYRFILARQDDVLTLSGFIPDNQFRERIMLACEQIPGMAVSDDMALARGASAGFADLALQAVQWAEKLKDGEIEISDQSISVTGTALSEEAYAALQAAFATQLPHSFTLTRLDVKRP